MVVVFFTLTDPPLSYPVIYVVANPVRGLLDREILEEHLQSSNERKKQNKKQNENDKKKEQQHKAHARKR